LGLNVLPLHQLLQRMDQWEAGVRKCKEGTCSNKEKNTESKSAKSSLPKKLKRCGHCEYCRDSCKTRETERGKCCKECIKKESGGDDRKKGCLKRKPCKFDTAHSDMVPPRKNKATESPEGKADPKARKPSVETDFKKL